MSPISTEPVTDRREQILNAAMICFAKHGFHQATMHDISAEAGVSVGLIYRYFENKDDVISAMAARHKQEISEVFERARKAPSLLEALEVLFTAGCCENAPQVEAAFVVDIYAEGNRNPRVAELIRDVEETMTKGVTDLIARAPERKNARHGLSPRELAELIFAVNDGLMMRQVLDQSGASNAERRDRQLNVVRSLWRLLFEPN
jgi:TetR/AcrR family transcriptional regulator, repressor for uid operon